MDNVETWQYVVIAGPAFMAGAGAVHLLYKDAMKALQEAHDDEVYEILNGAETQDARDKRIAEKLMEVI